MSLRSVAWAVGFQVDWRVGFGGKVVGGRRDDAKKESFPIDRTLARCEALEWRQSGRQALRERQTDKQKVRCRDAREETEKRQREREMDGERGTERQEDGDRKRETYNKCLGGLRTIGHWTIGQDHWSYVQM